MCQNTSCLSKTLAIAFANFLIHNKLNQDPLGCFHPPFNLEYMSHHPWYLYIFTWNFHQGCYRTLPLGGTPSLVFNGTYNQHDCWKQNILPMELFNTTCCNIYNERPAQNQNIKTTYHILELYNIAHYGIYNNHISTYTHMYIFSTKKSNNMMPASNKVI